MGSVIAQTVRGVVQDAITEETIIGASVVLKGQQTKGAMSGLDGSFSIANVSSFPATLAVSFVGYKSQEIVVENTSRVVIKLVEDQLMLSEVVVIGENRGRTDNSARMIERSSQNVVNIVSARSIEVSPDLSVANVLQRVSGVSVEKNGQGEGRYPVIRGMDKRYSYTLVDGIKIPSPDDKNRYVPMDIFPSDLLDRLEVSKSLTASMEGDAIGGTMNMILKDAPEQFTFKANLATGYSQYLLENSYYKFDTKCINDKSPAELHSSDYLAKASDFPMKNLAHKATTALPDLIGGLTVGGRFGKNQALGLLFSGSFQNLYRGTQSTFFMLHAQPDVNNDPVFDDMQIRRYSSQQTRTGINVKADYRLNNRDKITFGYLFADLSQKQARQIVDTAIFVHRTGPGNGRVDIDYHPLAELKFH